MRQVGRAVFLIAFAVAACVAPTIGFADEQLEGKVVRTNLTLCHPRPSGGGCEGTLTLETGKAGTAQEVPIKVIADTIIKNGPNFLVLPQTQDNTVIVTYVTEKGEKVAKSINVVGP